MTFTERVQAVIPFGFTERQAAFLVTVALHSGYCLRRQYATFTGLQYGKNVRDFLESLVDREFARRFTYRGDSGHIYHLNARRLYRAIGQEDNRNRRQAGPALVARKLMLLDYVLKEPGRDWLCDRAGQVRPVRWALRHSVRRAATAHLSRSPRRHSRDNAHDPVLRSEAAGLYWPVL